MSRSPCCAPSALKNLLPPSILHPKEFKSPNRLFALSPNCHLQLSGQQNLSVNKTSRNTLSPFAQCNNSNLQPGWSSPCRRFNFSSPVSGSSSGHQKGSSVSSVDSPQRLQFVSKIKTTITSSCNLLGRGRFGQVVLAKYKDEYVAVKIIKKASKYINETNGQRLSHPNIISILKIEQLDDDVLILMEPWGSLNLQQLLSISIRISWADVLSYSKQLANALDYCHLNGVLHLDVKPANIMVNSQQWIKLGDFGNSLAVNQLDTFQQRVGTVSYCAPEILQGDNPSTKSDVYSYGITLWQLDQNAIPFAGLSWPTIAYLVVAKNERPTLKTDSVDEKQERFARLYQNCWKPEASKRPSMSEIVATLNSSDFQ